MQTLWRYLFRMSLKKISGPMTSFGETGNRMWKRFYSPDRRFEVTVVLRDTQEPAVFSREELVAMIDLVRDQEKAQGWKAEPKV